MPAQIALRLGRLISIGEQRAEVEQDIEILRVLFEGLLERGTGIVVFALGGEGVPQVAPQGGVLRFLF